MKIIIAGGQITRQLTDAEILGIGFELRAGDGNAGVSLFPVPDNTNGGDAWVTGRSFRIQIGVSNTDLIRGFISATDRVRGDGVVGRMVNRVHIQDANTLFKGNTKLVWQRPAESDRARLLAFAAAFMPATLDTSWVLTGEDIAMPAKTYDGVDTGADLIFDLLTDTGKVLFVDPAWHLHFHLPGDGHVAGLSISDTAYNWTTVFPPDNPTFSIDSLEMVNKVIARDADGHVVTVSDTTSITAHDADGKKHVHVLEARNLHSVAELTARANREIADLKDGRAAYSLGIGPLTEAQLALIGPGHQITVTSAVLGLSAAVLRIASMRVRLELPDTWYATLDLGVAKRLQINPHLDRKLDAAARAVSMADFTSLGTINSANGVNYGYDETGAAVTPIDAPCSTLASNIPWTSSPCGAGGGSWRNRVDGERWYGFTMPADDGSVHEVRVTMTVGRSGEAKSWWLGVTPTAWVNGTTQIGSATKIAEGDTGGNSVTYRIPRNLLTFGATNYLVLSPGWQIAAGQIACDLAYAGPVPGTGSGHFSPPVLYVTLEKFGWTPGTVGIAEWVGPKEAADGTRTVFTLIGWNGKGSPQCLAGGMVISPADILYNRDLYTAALPFAPTADQSPRFKYSVGVEG